MQVLLGKIHKIKPGKHTVGILQSSCKCYNLHLICTEASSAAKLCDLAFGKCFPLTSKTEPVFFAVVCDVYVHHCECALVVIQIYTEKINGL